MKQAQRPLFRRICQQMRDIKLPQVGLERTQLQTIGCKVLCFDIIPRVISVINCARSSQHQTCQLTWESIETYNHGDMTIYNYI